MIPVLQPHADQSVIDAVTNVLKSGWWGYGPVTQQLEEEFAKYVGVKYAIACNSGTSALDLCLKAAGIQGGELITTPFTFVSDAIVGEWNGMDVIFADIDEDSFCLDPQSLVVAENTKAIIAVDSHGRLADWKGIREMSTIPINGMGPYTPLLVEDCAHAMLTPGAGQGGDMAIWSFQAVKTLPAGDGGMITTNNEHYYKELKKLTWLGVEKHTFERAEKHRYSWDYDIKQGNGVKGYMNDLTAAIVLAQLPRVAEMTAKRRAIQAYYNEKLNDVVKIPAFSHTVQYYTMKCQNRDKLAQYLADNNIASSVHFKPLSEMTYWKKAVKRPIPVTDAVWKEILSLPVFYDMKWTDVERVIKAVREFYL